MYTIITSIRTTSIAAFGFARAKYRLHPSISKPLRSLLFSCLPYLRRSTLGATAAIRERSINARQVLRVVG